MQVAQAAPEPALMEAQPTTAQTDGGPSSIWTGRRGSGYMSQEDAMRALPTRQKVEPDLDWRIEQMKNGAFRLAGYERSQDEGLMEAPTVQAQMTPSGNALLTGDDSALQQFLASNGITSFARTPRGLLVGVSQAQRALQAATA